MTVPLPAVLVRDLPVFPYSRHWSGGPEIARIPDHGRIRIDPVKRRLDSFPQELLHEPRETLSGSYLYGGPLYHHFGHVMVDSIIRLWAYDPAIHTDGVVFALMGQNANQSHPDFFFDICRGFGIERDRIRVIDRPTTVEAVHFAEPGSISSAGPEPWYLEKLERVERFFLDQAPADLETHERLFLGRQHLKRGSLMGEGYFASILAEAGFHYLMPEKYTIAAQIRLLKAAKEIVFTEGSTIHLTELMASLPAADRVAILLRRSGGWCIFKPHLDPRLRNPTEFVGREAGLFRLNHRPELKPGPNSLSYMLDPASSYADMVRLGHAVPGRFDMGAFLDAERAELEGCLGSQPKLVAAHVAEVAKRRREHGIALPA